MTIFSAVSAAPADPILGLTEKFLADSRPDKVNLGVGAYTDESGRLPLLTCVAEAERRLAANLRPRPYLPIDGLKDFITASQSLIFGDDSDAVRQGRLVTAQSLAGTGGLRLGAAMLHHANPAATVLVSDPTWANHIGIFESAGFQVGKYRYYDRQTSAVDFDAMTADLEAATAGTVVVLHACCHNPTGFDLTEDQHDRIIEICSARGLVPFVDMAYQGFARSIDEDAYLIRALLASGMSFVVATSYSKTMSLYGERIGTVSVVCENPDEAQRVRSQLKVIIRTMYSNPPTYGAELVATVLNDAQLRTQWRGELDQMRDRIKRVRNELVAGLEQRNVARDMGFINQQVGMFSFCGLTAEEMAKLADDYGIYGTSSGRICVAALNASNINYVADAIASVIG